MRSQAGLAGRGPGGDDRNGWSLSGNIEGGRERGTRRAKVYGYLKAANELRQTYSAQLAQKYQDAYEERGESVPDVEPVIYGNEEMVLFPAYSRHHRTRPAPNRPSVGERQPHTMEDAGYGQRKAPDGQEVDHAVVDVDVRGWIYSPHQAPLNRKNRILISLARRLSGIPAPDPGTAADNDWTSPGSSRSRATNEDTLVNNETDAIINGHRETLGDIGEDPSLSRNDIASANAKLMERLSPFLTNPVAGLPATVFFFNDKQSQSRHVSTNAGGHFHVRAALDFTPTQVRVLAAEHLSATSEIRLIEPRGVSVISDIDDTIKHSSIAGGTKEMFRNTFVRDLSELTVLGVKEWYSAMAKKGVGLHYVSNSPWQLYPLLKSYFNLAGLPPGSFHLKQYSGMLQGIFEPTSERKRPQLGKIIQDFPDRRFILVGDSGEADLEAYTELVVANPGKILAIFIRDVTTSSQSRFFDKSVSDLERPVSAIDSLNNRPTDGVENRPPLPSRRNLEQSGPEPHSQETTTVGQLIDLNSEDESPKQNTPSVPVTKPGAPVPPRKPVNLQASVVGRSGSANNSRQAPPVPDKPERLASTKIGPQSKSSKPHYSGSSDAQTSQQPSYGASSPYSSNSNTTSGPGEDETPTPPRISSSASAPPPTGRYPKPPPPVPPPRRTANNTASTATTTSTASKSTSDLVRPSTSSSSSSIPAVPYPRHQTLPHRPRSPLPSTPHPPSRPSTNASLPDTTATAPNKIEETWKRRWTRAQEILDEQGVILASWRVGADVQDLCLTVIESAQEHDEKKVVG